MNNLPQNREAWLELVKAWGWTIALIILAVFLMWQGLTLFQSVRSWQNLSDRVQSTLADGAAQAQNKKNGKVEAEGRAISSTFFYRPQPDYKLSAIFDNKAVINGQELKAGDRVGSALIEKIDIESVTIREDGSSKSREIPMHPGP